MKIKHKLPLWALLFIITAALLVGPRWLHAAPSPQSELRAVWQRVQNAGAYHFSADVTQTNTPLPTVYNAGRQSKETRLYLEGQTNVETEALDLTIWNGGGSVGLPETGLQVKVEGGEAFARQGTQPWEPIEDFSGLFAPGGDFLAYLAAADNVVRHAPETRATALGQLVFTRYTFDVNGPRFAAYMHEQMTRQLREQGELPPGIRLEMSDTYVGMTGQGELWVDENGLPIQQQFGLHFPQRADDHIVTARMVVDFSHFQLDSVTVASGLLDRAARDFIALLASPQVIFSWLLVGIALAGVALIVIGRRSALLNAALSFTIIFSMIVTPLLTTQRVWAFSVKQEERQLTAEAEQTQRDNKAQLQNEMLESHFDRNINPLEQAQVDEPLDAMLNADTTLSAQAAVTADYRNQPCTTTPDSDDDGDGLTNREECMLGTSTVISDTDQDLLDDYTEVQGVSFGGKNWYTDPNTADSNNDGITDGKEWLLGANQNTLPDTDGDGTPNIWDQDNDGDGVPDKLDLSPHYSTRGSQTFSGGAPFALTLNHLNTDKLTKVEFQISPTNADHLWYTLNVLNWPDNDKQGQIQDADGKSFYDVDNSLAVSPNDNGDVRMIPMLAIEISGANDNLPAATVLKEYGIAVQQTATNVQTAYVPLQLVTDKQGDKHVAFYGRMMYEPDSSWGNAQDVRLVWVIQALVDRCVKYSSGVCSEYDKYNETQIIQTYDDDWFLTGLHVTEEHGANTAIIYEDPTVAGDDAPLYMDTLFGLEHGLEHSFLAGRATNGNLDITVAEIGRRFNHTTNGAVSATERWNLPNVLSIKTGTYTTTEFAMQSLAMTETVSVLDSTFTPVWSASAPITPTIMYAWEQSYRGLNLEESLANSPNLNWSGNALTVDLATAGNDIVPLETSTAVKWAPYRYDSTTAKWQVQDIQPYWNEMTAHLSDDFADIADQDEAKTYQGLAQLTYLAIYSGLNSVVKRGDAVLTSQYFLDDQSLGDKIVSQSGSVAQKIVRIIYVYGPELELVREVLEVGQEGKVSTLKVVWTFLTQQLKATFGGQYGSAKLVFGLLVGLAAGGLLLYQHFFATDSATGHAVSIATAVIVGAIMAYFSVYYPVYYVYEFTTALKAVDDEISTGEALFATLTSSQELVNQSREAGVFGLLVSVALSIIFFAEMITDGKVDTGTIAFNQFLAQTIGAIILAVVFFVLSLSVVGTILLGIIGVVDIILILIGLGDDTVTAQTTLFFASILYQFDLSTTQKIENGTIGLQLADQGKGLVAGNRIDYTLPVTTTLQQTDVRSQGALRNNSFAYELSERDVKVTGFSTSTGSRSDQWAVTQYDTLDDPSSGQSYPLYQAVITDTPSTGVLLTAGVNVDAQLYLNTAYALDGLSCWVGFCSSKTVAGNASTEVGSSIKLDVLPATIDEFVDVAAWSGGEVTIKDADGDGLSPLAYGGIDPDDTKWDTDGDNLADGYELTLRARSQADGGLDLDPLNPDTDGDIVRDDAELRWGANPGNLDSDGDGLSDSAEIPPFGGWMLPYRPDAATRVWSSPLKADIDKDGMSDLFERTQDTCPQCDPWADPTNPQVFNPNVRNESPIAFYISDSSGDGFVAPGETVAYTTTVANNLSYPATLAGNISLALPNGATGEPLSAVASISSGFDESLVSNVTLHSASTTDALFTSAFAVTEYESTVWAWDPSLMKAITGSNGDINTIAAAPTNGWTDGHVVAVTLEVAADGSQQIVAYALTADGTESGRRTLATASDPISLAAPGVSCNEAGICLATWGWYDASAQKAQVRSMRLHQSLNHPSPITVVSYIDGYQIGPITVANDGVDFMVAWEQYIIHNNFDVPREVWVLPVRGDGQTIGTPQQAPTGVYSDGPAEGVGLAWGASEFGGYVVAWKESDGNIWYTMASADGALGERSLLTDGVPTKTVAPKLAFDPLSQQMLLVYVSGTASHPLLLARRMDASGISSVITLDTSFGLEREDLAANVVPDIKNGGWIVAWGTYLMLGGTNLLPISPDGSFRTKHSVNSPITNGTRTPGVALACFLPQPIVDLDFSESAGATKFDDDSDKGNNAFCAGSSCPLAGVSGRFGNGVDFDGVDDYLDSGGPIVELGRSDFTISAWVRTNVAGATTEVPIVTKSDDDAIWEAGEKSFYLNNVGQPTLVGYGNEFVHSTVSVNDNFWHHVALVWDYDGSGVSGTGRIYVDGVDVTGADTYAANLADNVGDTLKIGRPNFGEAPHYFSGSMDAITVYDRALSASEVSDEFDAAITLLDLDEVAGATVFNDATDSGFDATCSGDSCPVLGVDGVAYSAAHFDGQDDYLEIGITDRTEEIFAYNFNDGNTAGWSRTDTNSATTAEGATTFLGVFGNEPVTLTLTNLPPHDTIEVSFDLFLPGSWDGDRTDLGMDNWEWGYNSQQVFKSNFSNADVGAGNYQYAPANWWPVEEYGWASGGNVYGLSVGRDPWNGESCTGVTQTFTTDAPNLSTQPIGNDTISCILFWEYFDITTGILYEDANYQGDASHFDFSRGALPSYSDDAISSIRVWPAAHTPKHGAKDDTLSVSGYVTGTIYSFSHTFTHEQADAFSLYFKGDTLASDPEVWGLDNVVVKVKSVANSVPLANNSFTLAAWAKRDTVNQPDFILSQGTGAQNRGLQFGFWDNNAFACAFWDNDLSTSARYTDTDWHHWACTYDAATKQRILYRDGVQVANDTASAHYTGEGAMYIGKRIVDSWNFDGALDEVGIWTKALSADDVFKLYRKVKVEDESRLSCVLARTASVNQIGVHNLTLRETATNLGTDTQSMTTTITIDADTPVASVTSPSANSYTKGDGTIVLAGQADDPTSYITQVEVQIDGGGWQPASGTETWTYGWDAGSASEGAHTIQVRAVDAVGNVGAASAAHIINIDRTPPQNFVMAQISSQVRPLRGAEGGWRIVNIKGQVTTELPKSVRVLLEGPGANGWQESNLGSSWALSDGYKLSLLRDPSGVYTATAIAMDSVGNETTPNSGRNTLQTFTVDAVPPTPRLTNLDDMITQITQAITLTGTFTDLSAVTSGQINFTLAEQTDALHGTVLHLPFDEERIPDPQTPHLYYGTIEYYADGSGTNHPATCDSNCPLANAPGQRDFAIFLQDGNGVTVSGIALDNRSFTLATWAKHALGAHLGPLMSQGPKLNNQGLHFGFHNDGRFTCAFWGDDLDTVEPYLDEEWHYWACTYDAATRQRTIYRDGVLVAQDTASAPYQGSGPLFIGGFADGSEYFSGNLDELTIHQRALADYEVVNLYEYGQVKWMNLTLNGSTNPTWSFTIPEGLNGAEGIYQINVRGTDAVGNHTSYGEQALWRGEIDTRLPRMTFTAELVTEAVADAGRTEETDAFDISTPTHIKFSCTAVDNNLDEAATCRAVAPSAYPDFSSSDFITVTTYAEANQWYANTITGTSRLYQIDAMRTDPIAEINEIKVESCDAYGHCNIEVIDDTDGDGIPDTVESTGDRDGDGVADRFDYDPAGHFYELGSGKVTPGGQIALSGAGAVTILKNGVDGFYDWVTDGTPGIYTMTVTPPAGYALSPVCPPQPGSFGPSGDKPIFLGASEMAGTLTLADASCEGNPYYLHFNVATGDPFVFNNNIPLTKAGSGAGDTIFLPLIAKRVQGTSGAAADEAVVGGAIMDETVADETVADDGATGEVTDANGSDLDRTNAILLPIIMSN